MCSKTDPVSYVQSTDTFELAWQTKDSISGLPKTIPVRKEKTTLAAVQGWIGVANQHQLKVLET